MKLISMTDFVLNKKASHTQIVKYAKFLKQPLKLEMFVPCDDNGNVLQDPGLIPSFELEQYRKAKEKVLFENCDFDGIDVIINKSIYISSFRNFNNLTIESLIYGSVVLTLNATKQFL